MKLMIMLGCLVSIMSSNLVSQENTSEAEIVYDCSGSIRGVLDEKIYLPTPKNSGLQGRDARKGF